MSKVQRATGSWMCVCTICSSESSSVFFANSKQKTERLRVASGRYWSLPGLWLVAQHHAPPSLLKSQEPAARRPQ